jgi:hypothetical protein
MDGSAQQQSGGTTAVADDAAAPQQVAIGGPAAPPDWWHRDHPTFTAIAGFFSGLVFATLVPGLFVATVRALTSERTAEEAFPFVLLFLVIPIALVAFPQTRRFGKYQFLGIFVTLLVIFGVGIFVLWFLMTYAS